MSAPLNLPTELLVRIVAFTIPDDFESVMLSCKRIYAAGNIYREQHNQLSKRYRTFRFAPDIRSSLGLILAIANEPSISQYIKTAHLYNDGDPGSDERWEGSEHDVDHSPPPKYDERWNVVKRLLQQCEHFHMLDIDPDDWLAVMMGSDPPKEERDEHELRYACLFLLTLLPNVTAISVPRHFEHFYYRSQAASQVGGQVDWDFYCSIVRLANQNSNGKQSLSLVSHLYPCCDQGYEERLGLDKIGPMLALPAMRTVTAVSCIASDDGYTGIDFRWLNADLKSSVQNLELYACIMEGSAPSRLFEHTPDLRSFKLSHETKWHGCGHDWNVADFFSTLEQYYATSLKVLSVTFTCLFGSVTGRVGSFRNYTQLEELELDVRMLGIPEESDVGGDMTVDPECTTIADIPCLANILPPSIKSVRLITGKSGNDAKVLHQLFTRLHEASTEKLPNLESVTVTRGTGRIGNDECMGGQNPQAWEETKRLIEDQGYEYREVENAQAPWINDMARRFPYVGNEDNYVYEE